MSASARTASAVHPYAVSQDDRLYASRRCPWARPSLLDTVCAFVRRPSPASCLVGSVQSANVRPTTTTVSSRARCIWSLRRVDDLRQSSQCRESQGTKDGRLAPQRFRRTATCTTARSSRRTFPPRRAPRAESRSRPFPSLRHSLASVDPAVVGNAATSVRDSYRTLCDRTETCPRSTLSSPQEMPNRSPLLL